MRTPPRQRAGLRIPRNAFFRLHHRDGSFIFQKRLEKSGRTQSDGNFPLCRHGCRPRAACRIKKHVGVQLFDHLPAFLLAEPLHKTVKKHQSRARSSRVGHDNLVLKFRLQQIGPAARHRKSFFPEKIRIDADRSSPSVDPEPMVILFHHLGIELFDLVRSIGLQNTFGSEVFQSNG